MRRYLAILSALVALGLGLTAFSFIQADPPLPADPQGRGTLVCATIRGPGSLDHGYVSASSDFRITRCLQETLLRAPYGEGPVEPGCAEALPQVSADGLTYKLRLRADAKWSSGDPITADDFAFAWMRAVLPDTGSNYEIFLQLLKGATAFQDWRRGATACADALNKGAALTPEQEKFRAANRWLDDAEEREPLALWQRTKRVFAERVAVKAEGRDLTLTLERPVPYFADILAFQTLAPLHQKSFEARILNPPSGHRPFLEDSTVLARDRRYFTAGHLVCSGAYVLGAWRPKVGMRLDQNPHYWARDKMGNIRLDFREVADTSLMYRMFRDGQVDLVLELNDPELTANLVQARLAEEKVPQGPRKMGFVHNPTILGTYYYYFNCRPQVGGQPNPLADKRVRRALAMCVDRRAVIDHVSRLGQQEALTMVPPGCGDGYRPPLDAGVRFDPAAAAALLASTGLKMPAMKLLYNPNGAHPPIATAVRKAWEDHLGLVMTAEVQEWPVVLERRQKGDFWVARGGWTGDYNDPTTFLDIFRTGNPLNEGAWSNKEFDALLDAAADPAQKAERNRILEKAERLLLEEAPVATFYHYTEPLLYDETAHDLKPTARSDHRLECVPGRRR